MAQSHVVRPAARQGNLVRMHIQRCEIVGLPVAYQETNQAVASWRYRASEVLKKYRTYTAVGHRTAEHALLSDESVSALLELAEVLRELHEQFIAEGLNLLEDRAASGVNSGDEDK